MNKLCWPAVLALGAAALCIWIPNGSGQSNDAELWRHRNLGKALFESPTGKSDAPAELKKALALAPGSFRDRLNYGLALLRSGDVANGIAELEKAQKQNPKLPHTWFNLGVAYRLQGRYGEAIRQFQHMIELVPDEPVSHYNLGLLFVTTEHWSDALPQFQMSAKLDPMLVAPRAQIYNYYRLHGDEATAEAALTDFQKAKERQEVAGESEDMDWCIYAELYDPIQAQPPVRDTSPPAPLHFDDRKLDHVADSKTAGLLVLDADGDGRPDLLVWSRSGLLLYRNGSEAVEKSGLGDIRNIVSVAQGDYDNDGLPDLCVITDTGARLLRNARGRFEEAGAKLPDGTFHSAVWLDFDHDYDQDLFLLGAKSMLWRNRGNGTFDDFTAHFPFSTGEALSGEPFRTIPDTKGIDLAISYTGHKGILYRDRLRGEFEAVPLDAVPANASGLRAVDVDNDSWNDLLFSTRAGVSMARNRSGRFEPGSTQALGAFAVVDLENRGVADLIAANGVSRGQGLARFAGPTRRPEIPGATAWAEADFDDDGLTDLAAVAADGSLHLLTNRSASKNEWVRVALSGVKNLKMAPGAEVEVKAGSQYRKLTFAGVPLLFGLGRQRQIETVRITWPNGLIQNQPNERAAQTLAVKEAPRLSGSCPMIFTWNGRAFQFITDVLGVAPLGASAGDGQYFPVDHDEYVQIPGEALAPAQGRYEVRVTEELHEVSYLDQVRLVVLDHPNATEIFTNDKFKSPPFPEFRLFGVRQRIYPVAARDDAGRDILARVLRRDGMYASGFRHDYAGVAELHSLTLDFGRNTAPDNRAVLLLNGWVDWADGSTFLGAAQRPGGGLVFPYLQVKDSAGAWQTVVADMGIPSGKPKTIAVDLTGKFLSASREVRIVTNLCVYWNEIFLSESALSPEVKLTTLDAGSAELRLRGFSRTAIDPRREQPESFEYARWTSAAPWNQTPGFYTRYGDVRELMAAADDRFVIMGAGDELRLLFPAGGLPVVPSGWRRDFLLLVDGWAKDADANTAHSQSVEPLPFHAMSRYPYPPREHYPDDDSHRLYRKTYNIRPEIRFMQPLAARAH